MKSLSISLAVVSCGAVLAFGAAQAFDNLAWPDGRKVRVVQPNEQVDLSSLRSGVHGRAVDRRFSTNAAMYLANELYLSGTEFFLDASRAGLPIAHDTQFSYLTNVEAYWYSRYNLLAATAHGRLGLGVIHGPYMDMRAQHSTELDRFGRVRGELAKSNKDVMLTEVVAAYLERSGLPRKFENAVPLMLEFKSGDPHLLNALALDQDPRTGRAGYLGDFYTLRWSHGAMDHRIELGAVGQSMLKKVLWAKFFLRRNHTDDDFPGEIFMGNNAEDGFRGSMLTLEAVSGMLLAKAALFADPGATAERGATARPRPRLVGIDPVHYNPDQGLRYLPHEIAPTLVYMSDLPVRQYDFHIADSGSSLWDLASWLWATAEFFDYANPRRQDNWNRVFGYQTPYDGSVMEQKYALLARGLANTMLANLFRMHAVDGILVSRWKPTAGPGASVELADLSLAMVALGKYAEYLDLEPDRRRQAAELLRRQGDFLLKIAAPDGSYRSSYTVADGTGHGERDMSSQAFAIRGLLAAWSSLREQRYLDAATRTAVTWNADFWDDRAWLYRNRPGETLVEYTPVDVGAALAALRELILATHDPVLLERFSRFFVQALDASGLMQSEDVYTGEVLGRVRAGETDSDHDGIPFISGAHGRHGLDTVFASRVQFDLSNIGVREPAQPATRVVPVSGEGIYATNCEVCHGRAGVGNEGPRLIDNSFVQLTGHAGVASTVANGRLSVGMPAWGGVLTADEIDQVVEYIRALPGRPESGR